MTTPTPPLAEQRPHTVKFGKVGDENRGAKPMDPPIEREDPYFWLRCDKRESPDVLAHLGLEKAYVDAKTAPQKELEKSIYDEHIAHLKETDSTAPFRDGPFFYYSRTVKGLSYKIYCRRRCTTLAEFEAAPEEVYLDVNKLSEGKKQCVIGSVEASPKHDMVAFTVDFKGDEVYEMHFIGRDGEPVDKIVTGPLDGGIEWGADGETIYYTTRDDVMRSYRAFRHRLGTAQSEDELLFQEDDELFNVGMGKSLQGSHLVVGSGSSETSEAWVIDLKAAAADHSKPVKPTMRVVRPRKTGVRYNIAEISHGVAYIVTNADDCLNNKVIRAPLADLADWGDVMVAHNPERHVEGLTVFKTFAVAEGREGGLTRLWTMRGDEAGAAIDAKTWAEIAMPEPIFEASISVNCEFDATEVRFVYSSLTTPDTWFNYSPSAGTMTQVKQTDVLGYNPADYVCERRFATAPDGRQIPMNIVHHKKVDLSKGPHPTMLYGYGSYGICIDPSFTRSALPYMERGVVYCTANIRGGGEMGRGWYEKEGKYLTKRNTFSDFVACAEQLVDSKVTTPAMLACEGRSAGGLLIGATINMRPDLFKVAVAGVPFVDVMTTMCDPSIPLTTGEWEEWGNPNEAKYHDYMLSYSPMDNVRRQPYPNMLIVAGLHDPRVAYWEPTKWATKLRRHNTAATDVLLKMDMDCGHFSASDRYKYWREKAFEQAVVLNYITPGAAKL